MEAINPATIGSCFQMASPRIAQCCQTQMLKPRPQHIDQRATSIAPHASTPTQVPWALHSQTRPSIKHPTLHRLDASYSDQIVLSFSKSQFLCHIIMALPASSPSYMYMSFPRIPFLQEAGMVLLPKMKRSQGTHMGSLRESTSGAHRARVWAQPRKQQSGEELSLLSQTSNYRDPVIFDTRSLWLGLMGYRLWVRPLGLLPF